MTDLYSPQFDFILKYLQAKRGLNFGGNRSFMLKRRIGRWVAKTGSSGYREYFEYLQQHTAELSHLIDVLTINVSRFFRDTLVFDTFGKIILPALIQEKQAQKEPTLRIWSAGCATGEEPYSIAMLLQEFFKKEPPTFNLSLFATDIDNKSLSCARQAKYSPESIQNITVKRLKAYFDTQPGGYQLKPEIRAMVSFSHFDLLSTSHFSPPESIFGDFDIIFCRNVLIYFNADFQEVIFEKLHRSLRKNGLLVLGEAEILPVKYEGSFGKRTACCKIYRKI